jgi:hypothetical protein
LGGSRPQALHCKKNFLSVDKGPLISYIVFMDKKIKRVMKVLARKARGLDRKAKVQEMLYGLSCIACSFNHISTAEIGAMEKILKSAERARG